MDDQKHKVLIVEDRGEIAARLSDAVIKSDGFEMIGVATTLERGLDLLFAQKPRIVLIDLGLPDGSGIELIRAISGYANESDQWICDALVISIFGDESRVVQAIQAGAKGYILKGGGLKTICDDIQSVIDGGSPMSPQIARHLLDMVKHVPNSANTDDPHIELTARETEILRAVAKGYKRREIGEKLGISAGTVGNHIHNIYRKLNVGSNMEAVALASKIGVL